MKKILVALDNAQFLTKLKKCDKYDCYEQDISYMEGVIEYLRYNEVDCIITKDMLVGEMSKNEYIIRLKEYAKSAKIIMIVEEVNIDYKGFLLAHEINNIAQNGVGFLELLGMIDAVDNNIILEGTKKLVEKNIIDDKGNINVITKQTIAVFGTSGAGKSYIVSLMGKILSQNYKLNTLLVDMDIQNAAMDIYNNLINSSNILYGVMEDIDKDNLDSSILNKATKNKNNGKLSYITNNLGIYECQTKLSTKYYERIYAEANKQYDITVLDLPSSPFLDVVFYSLRKSQKIFFVVNPNYISMRQAIKYLDLMVNIWHIAPEKIYVIVNKMSKASLSISQITTILKGFNVFLTLEYSTEVEEIINGYSEIHVDNLKNIKEVGEIFGLEYENLKLPILLKRNWCKNIEKVTRKKA